MEPPAPSPWLPVLPLVAIAAAEAALGISQVWSEAAVGPTGTYVNHNHFAGFLEWCLPFPVVYAASAIVDPRRVVKALVALLLAVLLASAIVLSLSRMGVIASLCALLTVGFLAAFAEHRLLTRSLVLASLAAALALAWILVPPALLARFDRPAFTADAVWRTSLWRDTTHLIAAYPWFGCGLGSYQSAFPAYQTVALQFTVDYAHNDYLQTIAELGILPFAIGLCFLLRLFLSAVRAALREPSAARRGVALACAGSFVAVFAHSAADFNLYLPANAMLFAWIAGVTDGSTNTSHETRGA